MSNGRIMIVHSIAGLDIDKFKILPINLSNLKFLVDKLVTDKLAPFLLI